MLNYCCSSGDVLRGHYQAMNEYCVMSWEPLYCPYQQKFSVNLKFELDPLKVSSKELLMFLNVICFSSLMCFVFISQPYLCMFLLQHMSHGDGRQEVSSRTGRSGARCRNSIASCADEQPHIGNYRLLKTIGKGNFAKVKLARHILTGREVKWYERKQ